MSFKGLRSHQHGNSIELSETELLEVIGHRVSIKEQGLTLDFTAELDHTESCPRDGRLGDFGESTRDERSKMPERFAVSFTSHRYFHGYETVPDRSWYCNTVDSNVKASGERYSS